MDCVHQRDSVIGRLLRSCRACELEQNPAEADRAVRTWQRVEDVHAGRTAADDALTAIRADYGVVPPT